MIRSGGKPLSVVKRDGILVTSMSFATKRETGGFFLRLLLRSMKWEAEGIMTKLKGKSCFQL
jgi:hypothetical protein